jgi:predicted Zn-dependent peptidase
MKYHIHTLKNGLRIVLAPMQGTKTATAIVMSGTGSRYETAKENGLAHFLEHMFFKGTKKRPSARAISEELDGLGSQYNAFTSKDRTAYWAKTSAQNLDKALDVVMDIFLNSTLPQKEIEKERGAVIQEIDMYEDMPMRTVDNVFDALLFGEEHPLGRTILGPKENIRSFTRKEFETYHAKHYGPSNTIVCVAGNFDDKKVLAKVAKAFKSLKATPSSVPEQFDTARANAGVRIKEKKTDQTQLMVGVPAYPYDHKDEYALSVLASLLGGGMSSRLFMEVREKRGLAYSVHAWTDKYPDTGYFVVQAGVEHAKLEEALTVIIAEFKKVARSAVPAAELKKVKSYMKGTTTLAMESSDSIAEHAASSLIQRGRIRTLDEILKGIEKVTTKDVQRVAKDILKADKLALAVIGPHADQAKLSKLLA